jgi:Type IV secretion system pilin
MRYLCTAIAAIMIVALGAPVACFAQSNGSAGCNSAACVDNNTANYNAPAFVTLANYSKSPQIAQAYRTNGLAPLVNNIFKIALSVGAILAVLRIAYGGYMYMGSADMWGNKQDAKEIISNAIIGLILLFAIYLILFQINPCLLSLNVLADIPPVKSAIGAPTSCSVP